MRHPSKLQLRLVNVAFVLLLLATVTLLQWLSREYHWQFDWTQGAKNSLSDASIAAVARLDQPLTVTAFASERSNLRKTIRDTFGRYQRHKPDIVLEFVNPDTEPQRARKAGIRFDGEILLGYREASESLTAIDEESITNALVRLGHDGERWLVFLGGHGERSPDGQANFDLSLWAKQLRKRGFKTRVLNLAEHSQIPRNAAALVIAGPRAELLTGEVKAIEHYLDVGGNLLWLADPGSLYGLQPLAERLGIEFEPGVIVDPASEAITGKATAIVATRYGNHPTVKNFRNVTLFPEAVGIRLMSNERWQTSVLFDTRAEAWSETGALGARARLDKGEDVPGPLHLAVALNREHGEKQQRVLVVGDGDFLANTFLGNGINLDLGLSLVNWVSRDDAYVSIPVRVGVDRSLRLTQSSRLLIAGGFLFLLPLLLGGSGLFIWLQRRKR